MTDNKKGTGLKIALGLAIALFLATGIYTINLYTNSKETQKLLEKEKQSVIKDFESLSGQYENVLTENEIANENIVKANDRIQGLIDSLKTTEANVKILWSYKSKFNNLQKEMRYLLAQNDSLKSANSYLSTNLGFTRDSLELSRTEYDSLSVKANALVDVVENASVLSIAGLQGFGVKERSSGKLIPTGKARRADKIRVCFSVAKNKLVQAGDQELFVQVTSPTSKILGENKKVSLNNIDISYSVISKFNYENRSLDICEFVSPSGDFEKGTYTVKVYNQIEMVATTEFALD